MIQPEAYYAAHKRCRTPEELGRLGFIIVGRGEELSPAPSSIELSFAETLIECNEWHTENREALKEKWRKQKRNERAKDKPMSADVHQCPQDNDGHTDVRECPQDNDGHQMSTTLSPSLSPSLPHSLSHRDIRALPTAEEMKLYARQIGAEAYLPKFVKLMAGQDWAYINPSGNRVPVGKINFKTVLGSFYRQEKRNNGKTNSRSADRNEPYHEEGLADDVGV